LGLSVNEHDTLELLQSYNDAQMAMLAQVISLHLVMAAAIFYFLHRSGLAMKLAVFVLYALGNAIYVTQLYNASAQVVGAREHLMALSRLGSVSPVTDAVLRTTGESWSNAAAVVTNVSFLALWLGTLYFLFLWKRPKDI